MASVGITAFSDAHTHTGSIGVFFRAAACAAFLLSTSASWAAVSCLRLVSTAVLSRDAALARSRSVCATFPSRYMSAWWLWYTMAMLCGASSIMPTVALGGRLLGGYHGTRARTTIARSMSFQNGLISVP